MILEIVFVLYLIGSFLGLLLILIQAALKRLHKARFKGTVQWPLPWYYIGFWFIMAFVTWNNYLYINENGRQMFFILSVGGLLLTVITGFLHIIFYYPTELITETPRT